MDGIILLVLLVLAVPIGVIIWLAVKATDAHRTALAALGVFERLHARLESLENEVAQLREQLRAKPAEPPPAEPPPPPHPERKISLVRPTAPPAAPSTPWVLPPPVARPVVAPPVAAQAPEPTPEPVPATASTEPPEPEPPPPPVLPPPLAPPEPEPVLPPSGPQFPAIDWEQFMGVKLFAWIGGFALFLGLVFFLKYAFENHLVSFEMQMAGEYIIGLALLGGGLWFSKKPGMTVLSQTLCATSIVALYAITFAGHVYYHLIDIVPAFAVMVLITAAAFVLAVQLDAQVVAILGMLGGFLTPVMLPTGKDNPLGLFSYIGLLDIGLILVALRKRWHYLIAFGVAGTALMQMAWVMEFFTPAKAYTALAVFAGFEALFVVAFTFARKRGDDNDWLKAGGVAATLLPLWFVVYLFGVRSVAEQTSLFFTFVLAINIGLLVMVRQTRWHPLVLLGAVITLIIQAAWILCFYSGPKLWQTIAVVLGFEAMFLIVFALRDRHGEADEWTTSGATAMALTPFWFALYLLQHGDVAQRIWLYFSFALAADAGLLCVAWRSRWGVLAALAAAGTATLELAWAFQALAPERAAAAMTIFLGFDALFAAFFLLALRRERANTWVTYTAVTMAFVPVWFALHLQQFSGIAAGQPSLYFGYLLLADLVFAVLAVRQPALASAQVAGGGAVFFVLMEWLMHFLTDARLFWALGVILFFSILHAVFPIVLKRLRPDAVATRWWQAFPLISIGLIVIPILRLPELSWAVWLCVLLLDAVLFMLAILTAAVLAMAGAIVLTLLLAGLWLFRVPVQAPLPPEMLWIIGGFAVFFFVMSLIATKRLPKVAIEFGGLAVPLEAQAQLPALGAILPFVLLMLATWRLPTPNPSPVFALALLLVAMLLAVVRLTEMDLAGAVALVCTACLECIWQQERFHAQDGATIPLLWFVAFYAAFTVFPFCFLKRMQSRPWPWAVAALAGPILFTPLYGLVKAGWPELAPGIGIVPAVFAFPPLAGLAMLRRRIPYDNPHRLGLLAWFGGAALFFITLIFPIQFERQWLTISWALEGAALLWLFYRIPHPGLRLVGVGLLCVAFIRLSLNPAVLEYHARSSMPIFNWYLYSYGLVTVSLFVGMKLLAPPRNLVLNINVPALLATLGTILAFLLLNIEIADKFTEPGTRVLTFSFFGNFARDMTYSIAWALYALIMLVAGIVYKLRAPRYAALALLCVTLLKLFLSDLAHLNQLYRIGAFVGVAIVLLVASFLYQKFVTVEAKAQ
ncbi:MAG TPA: DUF2339 domain-containing protein [Verrucomicrobiae bacterium]|nr:DUF2339 domain-containing protein [Verrucomicrobiae bacterium]